MKKILVAILLLIGLTGYGQRFPSIDSAKAYVLRFIKTSAVEAFTNYRLQNVQYGTLELIDSIGSADSLKVDSVTVKVNTDSMFYWIGGTNHFVASLASAAAGGDTTIYSVILDSTGQANRRVLFAKNSKIASESRFLYDDTNHKLVINNPNISVDGTATKLFVNGNTTTSNLKIQNLATSNDTTANKVLVTASDGTVKKANWNNSGVGGGGSLNNIGTGYDVAVQNTSNVKRLQAGTGGIVLDSATSGVVKISSNGTAQVVQRGPYATRAALTPDTGTVFWQTDRLVGQYFYDGSMWNFVGSPLNYIFFQSYAGRSGAPSGAYITNDFIISGTGAIVYAEAYSGLGMVADLQTGTSTTGFSDQINAIATNTKFEGFDSIITYQEYKIMVPILADVTDDYYIQIGIGMGTSFPSTAFRYSYDENSGKWQSITRAPSSGSLTTKDCGITVAASTWYKLAIEMNGFDRSVKFYIDDVLVTTHISSDNVPFPNYAINNIGYGGLGIFKEAGTTTRTLFSQYGFSYKTKKKY